MAGQVEKVKVVAWLKKLVMFLLSIEDCIDLPLVL